MGVSWGEEERRKERRKAFEVVAQGRWVICKYGTSLGRDKDSLVQIRVRGQGRKKKNKKIHSLWPPFLFFSSLTRAARYVDDSEDTHSIVLDVHYKMVDGCESKLSSCTLFLHWKSRKRCISSCLACVIHDFGVNRRLAIGIESFIYTFFSFFLYLYFCLAKRKKVVGRRLPPTFFLFAWTGLFFFESFFFDETCARYVVT